MRSATAGLVLAGVLGCARPNPESPAPAPSRTAAVFPADSALTPRQREYLDTLAARLFDSPVAPVALSGREGAKVSMWLDYAEAQAGSGPIWLRVETPERGFLTVVLSTQRGGARVFAPWLPSWSQSVRATTPAEAGRWSLAIPGALPVGAWLHASLTEKPVDLRAFSHARTQGGRIAIGDFEAGADSWDALLARSRRPAITTSQRITTGSISGRNTGAETWRFEATAATPTAVRDRGGR